MSYESAQLEYDNASDDLMESKCGYCGIYFVHNCDSDEIYRGEKLGAEAVYCEVCVKLEDLE